MKVLITGATGLIGSELGKYLTEMGHELVVVTRNAEKARLNLPYKAEFIEKNTAVQELSVEDFKDVEAVINLAGESIDGRWTEEKKNKIIQSRTLGANNLLKNCPANVKVVITASAQGFYGERGDEILTEESPQGEGFLADVCKSWEEPFKKIAETKRVAIMRIGLVLSNKGGFLKKIIPIFQKNVGASLGSGQQWMSWVSIEDLIVIFEKALTELDYSGVINVVGPNPVQNEKFTQEFCHQLGVIKLPNVPSFILKTTLGEMADLTLTSTRVSPGFLISKNFKFKYTDLAHCLSSELASYKDGHQVFQAEQFIPYTPEQVFDFFAEAKNLQQITPEILNFKIEKTSDEKIKEGTIIDYSLKIHGVPVKWKTEIMSFKPPREFIDFQLKGPYTYWHHTHSFKKVTGGTLMTDLVRYKVPMGFMGQLVAGGFVSSDVEKIFDFRRKYIADYKFA